MAHYPQFLVAGFQQKVNDKLAMISWMETKKKMRSARQWEVCRDKTIGTLSFENKETKGFIIGKPNAWPDDKTSIIVWHPEGFFFRMDTSHLTRLVQFATVVNGEVQSPCVLTWHGSSIALTSVSDPALPDATINTPYKENAIGVVVGDPQGGSLYKVNNKTVMYWGQGVIVQPDGMLYRDAATSALHHWAFDFETEQPFQLGKDVHKMYSVEQEPALLQRGSDKANEIFSSLRKNSIGVHNNPHRYTCRMIAQKLAIEREKEQFGVLVNDGPRAIGVYKKQEHFDTLLIKYFDTYNLEYMYIFDGTDWYEARYEHYQKISEPVLDNVIFTSVAL